MRISTNNDSLLSRGFFQCIINAKVFNLDTMVKKIFVSGSLTDRSFLNCLSYEIPTSFLKCIECRELHTVASLLFSYLLPPYFPQKRFVNLRRNLA